MKYRYLFCYILIIPLQRKHENMTGGGLMKKEYIDKHYEVLVSVKLKRVVIDRELEVAKNTILGSI